MRLIDADAFESYVRKCCKGTLAYLCFADLLCGLIRQRPTCDAVKTPQWIPVEERIPEPGVYLVTCDDKDYPVKRMRMKEMCFYDHDGIYDGKVYAWMPLPEPYGEGKDETT